MIYKVIIDKINELIRIGEVCSEEFIRNNKELAEANLNTPMYESDSEFAKALLSEKHADIDMSRDEYFRLRAWAETVISEAGKDEKYNQAGDLQ